MKASRFMKLSNITRRLTLKTLTGVEAADADHFSFRRAGSLPEFGHACDSKWWTASTQQLSILLTNHLSLHEADTLVSTQCVWNHTSISFELLFPCQTTSWGCILCDATVAQKKSIDYKYSEHVVALHKPLLCERGLRGFENSPLWNLSY